MCADHVRFHSCRPYIERLPTLCGHIEQEYKKWHPLMSYSKKLVFKILVVVVVQLRQTYLKNQVRYEDETLHKDRNP